MILGLSIPAFIALHVAISLIGIIAGLAALLAQAKERFLPQVQALFPPDQPDMWLNLFVLVAQGLLLVAMLIRGAAIVRQPSVLRKVASRSIA